MYECMRTLVDDDPASMRLNEVVEELVAMTSSALSVKLLALAVMVIVSDDVAELFICVDRWMDEGGYDNGGDIKIVSAHLQRLEP